MPKNDEVPLDAGGNVARYTGIRTDYEEALKGFRESLGINPGEPLFVLRGSDALSEKTVRFYAMANEAIGGAEHMTAGAHRVADAIAAWPKKKLPDAEGVINPAPAEDVKPVETHGDGTDI